MFGLGGFLLSIAGVPVACAVLAASSPVRRRQIAQACIHRCFQFFVRAWRGLGIIDYRIENAAALREDDGCVIVANHPSLIDYVLLVSLMPRCDCIVKEQLWDSFFLRGIICNAGYIPNRDVNFLLERCREKFAEGGRILIFPEGTRTRPGRPPELQRGAANIAVRCRVPVRVCRIFCEPPFLTKGERWWFGTPRQPLFRVVIGEKIMPSEFCHDGETDGSAARRLTELLAHKFTVSEQ